MTSVLNLPPVVGKATTAPLDVTKLSTKQIAALTAAQVKALGETNIRALTAEQVGALSTSGVSALTGVQTGLMATSQVAAFKTTQIAALSSTAVGGLSSNDIRALSAQQVGALAGNGVKGLTSDALGALSNTQVGAINATAIKSLSTAQVNSLSAGQFSAMGTTQLRGLAAAQINALSDAKLGALTVSALTTAQIAGIEAVEAVKLSTTQLTSLSAQQVGAFSVTASGALTSSQVASLNSAQLGAMKATTIGEAGGLRIDLIWGASVSKAPEGFRSAVIAAAKSFTDTYSNNALINIQVGFGETNGSAVSSSAVAQSMSRGSYSNYATVRTALLNDAGNSDYQASADATLGATDPTGGGKFLVNTAQQKALGLAAPTSSAIDGFIGLSKTLPMDYTHSGAAGKYDAVGALQHEISEVLGRTGSVGRAFGTKVYTSLDLFRYKPAGNGAVRSLTTGATGDFFSIDGGVTRLGAFNSTTGSEDYADWGTQEAGDAYGFGMLGVKAATPARDIIAMAAIGYNLTALGLAAARGGSANAIA